MSNDLNKRDCDNCRNKYVCDRVPSLFRGIRGYDCFTPRLKEEMIMTPEEFEERMKQLSAIDSGYPGCDMEDRHREMDNLMCELLGSLGYGAGVEIFQETDKWYA